MDRGGSGRNDNDNRTIIFETSRVVRMSLLPLCTSHPWLADLEVKEQHFSAFVTCSAS